MPDARVAIHAALTAVILWLGLLFVSPSDTFGASHTFDYMSLLATETEWGVCFVLVGIVGVAGLVSRSDTARMISVLCVATAHAVFAAFLLMGNSVNSGTGTYSILAALGYYLAYRRVAGGF